MDNYNKWLNDGSIKDEDKEILKNMSNEEINNSFYDELSFGTAGIRGVMGLGSNKINEYTIGKVTVGLSNYLNKTYNNPSVVIAYDTRNNSKEFAISTALILNNYGIKTYIFNEVTSTPELSFSIKYLNCNSGIVITSSHNSKIYNGYKIYNSLGGQIVAPEDELITNEINNIKSFELIKKAPLNNELFNYVDDDVHNAFLNENIKALVNKNLIDQNKDKIKITYSSVHGVGLKTAEELFKIFNINNYNIVKEQCTYDGNFPTAPEPNPEYINNFDLGIKYAKENNSDIILMTDPDADRLGVMYKDNNEYKYIDGDLLGAIFAYYLINNKDIKPNSYMVRSIVTTPFIDKMGLDKNIEVYEVLTGCKNIANKRNNLKDKNYFFGYEESLGYMFDINVNDKNGFSSMLVFIEILCYCKQNNITIGEYIDSIFKKYGYFLKETVSYVCSSSNYKEIISDLINKLRNNEIKLDGNYVIKDYLNEVGECKTNALKYTFNDDSWLIIRPSGTEPKIKIYIGASENNYNSSLNKINLLKEKISKIINF